MKRYNQFQCKIHFHQSHNLNIGEVEYFIKSRAELKPLHLGTNFIKIGKIYKCVSTNSNIYLDDLNSFLDVKLRNFITWDRLKYTKYKSISAVVNNRLSSLSIFNLAAIMKVDCDLYYHTTIQNRVVYRLISYKWRKHSIHIKDILPTEYFSV